MPQLPGGARHFLPDAANRLQPADQSQQSVQHPAGDGGDQSDPDAGLRERPAPLPADGASQRGARQPEHGHGGQFSERGTRPESRRRRSVGALGSGTTELRSIVMFYHRICCTSFWSHWKWNSKESCVVLARPTGLSQSSQTDPVAPECYVQTEGALAAMIRSQLWPPDTTPPRR